MCSGYQGWCSFYSPRSGSYHDGNVDSNTFIWKFSSNETVSCNKIRAKLGFEDLESIVIRTRTDVTHRRNESMLHE